MIMAASEHQLQDWKYENKLLEKFLRPTETEAKVKLQSLESVRLYFLINTFIQQGHVILIYSDSKDIYNVTQDFYFK